jgi:hypothetical protein
MLKVTFIASDYHRWMSALKRAQRTAIDQTQTATRHMAIGYKNLLSQFISTNSFPFDIPGLSKDYLDWKREHGFPTRIGMLKGELLASITAFPLNKGWFGGVDPRAIGSAGKNWSLTSKRRNLILEYALWLEEGNRKGKQPPRPIFERSSEYYASNKWMDEGNRALRRIRQSWR